MKRHEAPRGEAATWTATSRERDHQDHQGSEGRRLRVCRARELLEFSRARGATTTPAAPARSIGDKWGAISQLASTCPTATGSGRGRVDMAKWPRQPRQLEQLHLAQLSRAAIQLNSHHETCVSELNEAESPRIERSKPKGAPTRSSAFLTTRSSAPRSLGHELSHSLHP